MKQYVRSTWPLWVAVGFVAACLGFFQTAYPYHFYFKGQNQLMLMSWSYVTTLFAKPAWAACWTGELLTQLFYYDYAGAIILTMVLAVLLWLTYQSIYSLLPKRWIVMAVALLVVLREASCHLYFGYVLSSTMALAGGLAMFLALQPLMRRQWPWALVAVSAGTAVCYWLFGYGVWAFLLLSAFRRWRIAVPVAALMASVLPLLRSHYNLTYADLCQYPGIGSWHMPNYMIEDDLHMMHSYETGDWNDVVRTAESDALLNRFRNRQVQQVSMSAEERTSLSVRLFFYNLVQAQRGKLPDVLLNYYPNYLGTFTSMIGQKIPMMLFMNMHEYYYAIGDISYAEKTAFTSCVCVPGNKNAYDIRRLAECALVKGDPAAAEKYLGLLRQTIPYREWADNAPHDSRYRQKAKYMNQQDIITPTDNSHRIMTMLLRSNPDNVVALDYMLCSLLLVKELDNFKRDYDLYCKGESRNKRVYQEALCIWLMTHDATEEEWQRYVTDEEVLKRLNEYLDDSSSPALSDSYWHYYDTFNFEAF